jgi:cytochrome c biogenesis protein CcdA
MLIFILAYAGGVLTILSLCILPVLPFVFARAEQPFVKSGLPLLLGMALTFSLVASLAVLGGDWAAHANQYGRYAAMLLLTVFGLTLLFPTLAEHFTGGRSAARGRSAPRVRRSSARQGRSSSTFMRATCTSCSASARMERRFAFA